MIENEGVRAGDLLGCYETRNLAVPKPVRTFSVFWIISILCKKKNLLAWISSQLSSNERESSMLDKSAIAGFCKSVKAGILSFGFKLRLERSELEKGSFSFMVISHAVWVAD